MGASAGATEAPGGHGDLARDIAVTQFRQIMFLPLTLSVDARADLRETVGRIVDGLSAHGWSPVTDLLGHLEESGKDGRLTPEAYAEFVYFHGFIQKFLFRKQEGKEAPDLRLFWRSIGAVLSVELPGFSVSLNIERLSLYLFVLGVAILVLEVAAGDDPRIIANGFHNTHCYFIPCYSWSPLKHSDVTHDSHCRAVKLPMERDDCILQRAQLPLVPIGPPQGPT